MAAKISGQPHKSHGFVKRNLTRGLHTTAGRYLQGPMYFLGQSTLVQIPALVAAVRYNLFWRQ
jgi:hypothetical protein